MFRITIIAVIKTEFKFRIYLGVRFGNRAMGRRLISP